jgi:SAM-dependent methyltransferase
VQADSKSLNIFEGDYFGAVVSVYALHEFGDALAVLKELNRVLEPRGKQIIVDFILGGEAERLWGERYYTIEKFKSMLKLSGFGGRGQSPRCLGFRVFLLLLSHDLFLTPQARFLRTLSQFLSQAQIPLRSFQPFLSILCLSRQPQNSIFSQPFCNGSS